MKEGVLLFLVLFFSSFIVLSSSVLAADCNDHKDNDGDGFCDYSGKKAYCTDGSRVGDSDCKNKNSQETVICKPSKEICDGIDNNCNGLIDEELYQTRSCGSNIGECKKGVETSQCVMGEYQEFGNCENSVYPTAEMCDNKDNNCNGLIDDDCFSVGAGVLNLKKSEGVQVTGAPIKNTCTDSDALNYYNVGIVSGYDSSANFYSKRDFCNGNLLNEYYCSGTAPAIQIYTCTYGCLSGKCLSLPDVDGTWCSGADINHDGLVDTQDFTLLKANFGKSGMTQNEGDVNHDGLVDTQDFTLLKANFGNGDCSGAGLACQDGTLNFECSGFSINKYCSNGALIDKCNYCQGCTGFEECGVDEKCHFLPPAPGLTEIVGSEVNDVFQIKYGKIYLNGVDMGEISAGMIFKGLGGNDTFTTVGAGTQVIYGGEGLDSFWIDSTDSIMDDSEEELNGPSYSPVSSVHIISEYYQPVLKDSTSRPSLETLGQNLVDPLPVSGIGYSNFISKPLFSDNPEYNDILQGNAGDCYYLSSLSSFTFQNLFVIKQAIVDLGDGTYVIRYYRNNLPVYVRVDADLPSNNNVPFYAKLTPDNELWVAIMEKTYAQFRSGQNSYLTISGGMMDEVYNAVVQNGVNIWTEGLDLDTLKNYITNGLNLGYSESAGAGVTTWPITGNHAYAIKSVSQNPWTITLYNPFGVDINSEGQAAWDSNPYDGLLEISGETFKANYAAWCESRI